MKVVILAGGKGTRLFPLSRECLPKQFLHIAGNDSLLAQTIKRMLHLVSPEDIVIVTNDAFIFHVEAELKNIHAEKAHIITEPVGRNTAPAIAYAAAYCRDVLKCDATETLFVCPSDHLIRTAEKFSETAKKAEVIAQEGYIVILGVVPDSPKTGYGYIEKGDILPNHLGFKVKRFVEKPDKDRAEQFIKTHNYLWNAGMFMFPINLLWQELQAYNKEIYAITKNKYNSIALEFDLMPDISIDYAVAEKSQHMAIVPLANVYWNDIGSFDAISEVLSGEDGNTIHGDVLTEDCHNSMILGEKRLIAGIGLDDVMVVDTPDVLLVARKGESQKVKQIVSKLKEQKRKEVSENVTMYRPWGTYTILAEGPGYKVKRIVVNPGQKLSLQLHYHRSEHWTVISGTGKCTLEDKTVIFRENESTYIPIGVKHRLENPGKIPLAIIEVQNGKYLGEDDIVRFDDIYGRYTK